MEDTKARIVVVASKALPAYLEANARLAEEDRVQHILVLDAEPGQKLPPGVSSFRALYQDDGSQCPETLPGEAASQKYLEYLFINFDKMLGLRRQWWFSGQAGQLCVINAVQMSSEY